MDDGWDDWGDDNDKSANGSDKSAEGWGWPTAEAGRSAPSAAVVAQHEQQLSPRSPRLEIEARDAATEELTRKYFLELRNYQQDLADPSVRAEINQELKKRDFTSLSQYYDGREDLARYTIDTELRRMKYSVVAEDGRRLGVTGTAVEAEAAKSRVKAWDGKGGRGGSGGGGCDIGGPPGCGESAGDGVVCEFLSGRKDDAMLRMANQSIFADMLEAIQGRLLRPDLEISVISRNCEFVLDFSKGILEACSLFEISTVGSGEPGAPETLEIALIKGTVVIDTRGQVCSQSLLSPQLRMVFDDAMCASARLLALHSLMNGAVNGTAGLGRGSGGGGGGGGSTSRQMGSLRRNLVRAGTDGMGRAAAAGTDLLANVVAGVGSAIGASRTGAESRIFSGEVGSRGEAGRRDSSSSTTRGGEAPLVQLYRRTDEEVAPEQAGGSIPTAAAAAGVSRVDHGRRNTQAGADAAVGGQSATNASPELERSGMALRSRIGRHDHGGVTSAAAAAGEGVIERRSALEVASATGGAVLRGLWGGVQSAAAAGVAVAARQGGNGGGESELQPEFRLYRREGES